jgi:hypothetical protein
VHKREFAVVRGEQIGQPLLKGREIGFNLLADLVVHG